jgi:F-type H+-transporting ATPase subunit epsilon
MGKLSLEIVTAERVVYSDEVDLLIAVGVQGQMALLPDHASLMTMLVPGELVLRKGVEDSSFFVSGGFLELMNNKVVILADSAERAEEIDVDRAEQAKQRAEERMALRGRLNIDTARSEAALRRSLMRLKIIEKTKVRKQRP